MPNLGRLNLGIRSKYFESHITILEQHFFGEVYKVVSISWIEHENQPKRLSKVSESHVSVKRRIDFYLRCKIKVTSESVSPPAPRTEVDL